MTSTVFAFQRWIHVFVVLTWRMFKNHKHNGCTWCFTPLTFFPKGPTFIIPLRFTDNNLVHDAFYLICYRLNAKKPRDLSCNNKFIAYVDYVSVTCFSHHLVFWLFPFHIRKRARKLSQKNCAIWAVSTAHRLCRLCFCHVFFSLSRVWAISIPCPFYP